MPPAPSPLGDVLARYTRDGELYEKLPGDRVRCFACGHRCLIPPGQLGVCKVRFNEQGHLRVPFGYVGALQVDPVEKKPFFHALPGSVALSFGMLGCDLHCGYCFTGDTIVETDEGPATFEDLFAACARTERREDAELAYPDQLRVIAASGRAHRVAGLARHVYRGSLAVLDPAYLPVVRCTADHRVYSTRDPAVPPTLVAARELESGHYLAIPRRVAEGGRGPIDLVRMSRHGTIESADFHLVPLNGKRLEAFAGPVYNMEVEEEHSYTAGFFAVSNCQNWVTSQALRDPAAVSPPREMTAGDLVTLAKRHGAPIITSTYNEPLITSEWAVAVFREAKAAGLVCSYVSNGNGTEEVLDYIQPYVSLYKVDLKSFRDRHYRELGGTLERVLWTIRDLHRRGIWVEIVTLIIPGFNDSNEELRDVARFLASVSPDIPWHVTAFHQDYKMTDPANTDVATLLRAAEIGKAEGLRFVYAGNLPGRVGRWENTYCPACEALLVERYGFRVQQNRLENGSCPDCRRAVPGFWAAPAPVSLATD